MIALGAGPVEGWQSPAAIHERALPALPPRLRGLGERMLDAFARLPPDPLGSTFGFFDGHGWNMAFDPARQRLNGVYDFADSGIGPLHQEFIYSTFVSPDLTRRIVSAYETFSGRVLDQERIALLTGVHRLSELAELAEDPAQVPRMIRHFADWASAAEGA